MRILVIDDSFNNQTAAVAQLSKHDLTVVGSYIEGQEKLGGGERAVRDGTNRHDYDAVLVDLLMPASKYLQGEGLHLAGQEMPVGIFLALLAAKNGAKYVALLTDSNHHAHPASACIDSFNEHETKPTIFQVEGARVLLANNRLWINRFRPDNLKEEMLRGERTEAEPVWAKNWAKLLAYLLDPSKVEE